MQRVTVAPRDDWKATAADHGFDFHSIDGDPYWDESAYYLAERFLSRAKNNGFKRSSFLSFITNKDLREETIKGLMEIGTLE